MSESDSFISEVTEEVRRERFYGFLRRYGWLIGALVALIVGGAAWHEWSKARAQAAAEAAGDALRAALLTSDPAARATALAALPAGSSTTVARLAEAGALLGSGDRTGAAALLEGVAADDAAPALYRSLAALQRVMILGPDLDSTERLGVLDGLAAEEGPFRLLALEQRALVRLEAGDSAAAIADFEAVLATPTAPEGLRDRVQQLLFAAGGGAPATAPGG